MKRKKRAMMSKEKEMEADEIKLRIIKDVFNKEGKIISKPMSPTSLDDQDISWLLSQIDSKDKKISELNELAERHESIADDRKRIVRNLDVIIHGEEGAAKQAVLIDLITPIKNLKDKERIAWALISVELGWRGPQLTRQRVSDFKYLEIEGIDIERFSSDARALLDSDKVWILSYIDEESPDTKKYLYCGRDHWPVFYFDKARKLIDKAMSGK